MSNVTILQGDWIERLRELPDNSVHCGITSPPYFGLRNYGVEGQAGLEKTPNDYIANMVAGFREFRRVLREDGVLWLNLGDSYANDTKWGGASSGKHVRELHGDSGIGRCRTNTGLKSKDLIGIPHRVAFALQADGWYLRAICPWLKRNGMPESCRDRPTQTIEYIFLLTKSPKYFYDAEAVKLAGVCPAGTKGAKGSATRADEEGVNARPPEYKVYDGTRLRRSSDNFFESFQGLYQDDDGEPLAFVVNTKPYKGAHFATFPPKLIEPMILAGTSAHGCCSKCGAPWERVVNRTAMVIDRSERTHELGRTRSSGTMVSPAMSETIGWQPNCECNGVFVQARVLVEPTPAPASWKGSSFDDGKNLINHANVGIRYEGMPTEKTARLYKSDLSLDRHPVVPCTVLDPFGGSGTTGEVARQHGRSAVLIELNPEYLPLIQKRVAA